MTRPRLYTTTALSLGLASLSGAVAAQGVEVTAEDLGLFSPTIQQCLTSELGIQSCAPFQEVITRCAADITQEDCVLLLEDDAARVVDAEQLGRAQEILQQIDDALHDMPDATGSEGDQDLSEAAPALDAPEAETPLEGLAGALGELFSDTPEEETEPLPDASEEDQLPDAPEISDEPPEADTGDDQDLTDSAEPQQDALGALGQMLETLQRGEVPEIEDAPEGGDANIAQLEAEQLEAERQRLRAEAEEMAEEAPELIVEDIPEEEVVAPVEAPRALDTDQQAAIEQLMQSPEISSAIGVLGAMLGVGAEQDASDVADEPRTLAERLSDPEDPELEESVTEGAEITEEAITRDQIRTSRDDFASRLALDFDADAQARPERSNRRDLERAGLAALSALAVGMVINQNRVVARSDERVVVDRGDGDLALWRDDDSILPQDGSTRRIERFDDGSTRTRWQRADGTETITIRDATGRVLRRERVLADGTVVILLDDTRASEAIDVSILPPPRTRELRITPRTDPELAIALLREAEADARALDRRFSLRQVREERVVRELVPLLSPDPITFETNRANVRPEEASKLLQVGRLMERLLASDPREIFLIEGHTDATGPAAFNLALSDRRAESVALALTEFFDIPPENLVVQGYGKRYLRIPTLAAEERNRRVAIRRVTPLLQ
ncbi:MAG: OmpA family protein [Natronohydrobacter sp.]|nr:OmpA family protein [Natronohydrobacter sp.]